LAGYPCLAAVPPLLSPAGLVSSCPAGKPAVPAPPPSTPCLASQQQPLLQVGRPGGPARQVRWARWARRSSQPPSQPHSHTACGWQHKAVQALLLLLAQLDLWQCQACHTSMTTRYLSRRGQPGAAGCSGSEQCWLCMWHISSPRAVALELAAWALTALREPSNWLAGGSPCLALAEQVKARQHKARWMACSACASCPCSSAHGSQLSLARLLDWVCWCQHPAHPVPVAASAPAPAPALAWLAGWLLPPAAKDWMVAAECSTAKQARGRGSSHLQREWGAAGLLKLTSPSLPASSQPLHWTWGYSWCHLYPASRLG